MTQLLSDWSAVGPLEAETGAWVQTPLDTWGGYFDPDEQQPWSDRSYRETCEHATAHGYAHVPVYTVHFPGDDAGSGFHTGEIPHDGKGGVVGWREYVSACESWRDLNYPDLKVPARGCGNELEVIRWPDATREQVHLVYDAVGHDIRWGRKEYGGIWLTPGLLAGPLAGKPWRSWNDWALHAAEMNWWTPPPGWTWCVHWNGIRTEHLKTWMEPLFRRLAALGAADRVWVTEDSEPDPDGRRARLAVEMGLAGYTRFGRFVTPSGLWGVSAASTKKLDVTLLAVENVYGRKQTSHRDPAREAEFRAAAEILRGEEVPVPDPVPDPEVDKWREWGKASRGFREETDWISDLDTLHGKSCLQFAKAVRRWALRGEQIGLDREPEGGGE